MEESEIEDELTAAAELLASTHAAHLAYTAKDGTPRVVPVGFYWTGEEFVVASAPTSPKVAALRERPAVALAIDDGPSDEAVALSVRGRAELEVLDQVVPEYVAAARESMAPQDADEFEEHVRRMYPQHVRIAIRPQWARFWNFSTGRMPGFLRELADQAGER